MCMLGLLRQSTLLSMRTRVHESRLSTLASISCVASSVSRKDTREYGYKLTSDGRYIKDDGRNDQHVYGTLASQGEHGTWRISVRKVTEGAVKYEQSYIYMYSNKSTAAVAALKAQARPFPPLHALCPMPNATSAMRRIPM